MANSEFTIYATADLHGYHDRLDRIADNVVAMKPDVLVIAGDITGRYDSVAYIRRLNDLPVPVLMVRGNMDAQEIERFIELCPNVTSLHQREVTINGVKFVGMGGTIPVPFSSRICLREKQMIEAMDHLIEGDSVLVVHPPPYGTLDEGFGNIHAGSRGLRQLLLEKQPKLLICGHIHEKPGSALIEKTLVVNGSMGRSGAGALIALHGDAEPTVRML
ncbi:MAG: metallophosphoesterase [Pseudomonadota bacterium]